jgi:hypothetical protein
MSKTSNSFIKLPSFQRNSYFAEHNEYDKLTLILSSPDPEAFLFLELSFPLVSLLLLLRFRGSIILLDGAVSAV